MDLLHTLADVLGTCLTWLVPLAKCLIPLGESLLDFSLDVFREVLKQLISVPLLSMMMSNKNDEKPNRKDDDMNV